MKKYLYEVRPVKPVMTPEGKSTRRPFSSLLSKEEVMGYMRSCTIYRRFSNAIAPVRVTGSNLEELHRDKYKEEKTIVSSPEQVAEIPLNEKPKDIEYPSFDEETSAVEEKNENPVEESVVETKEDRIVNEEEKVEDISTEEVTDEKSEIVEESIETTVEESVSEESVAETIEVPVVNENPIEEQVVETTEANTDVKPTQNDQNRDNHTTKNIQVNYNKNKNKR